MTLVLRSKRRYKKGSSLSSWDVPLCCKRELTALSMRMEESEGEGEDMTTSRFEGRREVDGFQLYKKQEARS